MPELRWEADEQPRETVEPVRPGRSADRPVPTPLDQQERELLLGLLVATLPGVSTAAVRGALDEAIAAVPGPDGPARIHAIRTHALARLAP